MFRVGLLTNEPILAEGFSLLVNRDANLEFAGTFSLIEEVGEGWRRQALDVLVVDLESAFEGRALFGFAGRHPELKVILWGHAVNPEVAYQALKAGVKGILRRTLSSDLHCKCMTKVAQGETWFEKDLLEKLVTMRRMRLSRRESQLVGMVSRGAKNKEIARELMLSEGTVKVYLSRLFKKLDLKDRYELALYGLKNLGLEKTGSGRLGASGYPAPGVDREPLTEIALSGESESVRRLPA